MATLELMKCYHKKSMFTIHFYSKVKSPGNQHRLKIHKNPHGSSFRRPEKSKEEFKVSAGSQNRILLDQFKSWTSQVQHEEQVKIYMCFTAYSKEPCAI